MARSTRQASGATSVGFIALKETIKTPRALSPSLFKTGSKGPTLIHFLMKRRMFGSPLGDPTARTRPLCPGKQSGGAGSWPIAVHPAPPFLSVVLSNFSSPGRPLRHSSTSYAFAVAASVIDSARAARQRVISAVISSRFICWLVRASVRRAMASV